MANFGIIADIALYYEIGIFLLYNYFLRLVYLRRKEKPTHLTNLLFKVFIGYDFAIIFSIVSKLFNVIWGGVPYQIVPENSLWIVGRLHSGRFGFVGATIGTIYSYELYLSIFKKQVNQRKRKIMLAVGIGTIIFLVFGYQFDIDTNSAVQIYELIAFILMFLFMVLVYIPFMKSAFYLARRIGEEQSHYSGGIKSLGHMASSFIGIFFSLVLDRVMLIAFNWAYSAFYFLSWVFAITGIYAAYAGYIKPSMRKED